MFRPAAKPLGFFHLHMQPGEHRQGGRSAQKKNVGPKWILPSFPQLHKYRALTLKTREFSLAPVDG
jgi:hypothetical protein